MSDEDWQEPQEFVTIKIVCDHCGEEASCTMTAETADAWADAVKAAAIGMDRVVAPVDGEG